MQGHLWKVAPSVFRDIRAQKESEPGLKHRVQTGFFYAFFDKIRDDRKMPVKKSRRFPQSSKECGHRDGQHFCFSLRCLRRCCFGNRSLPVSRCIGGVCHSQAHRSRSQKHAYRNKNTDNLCFHNFYISSNSALIPYQKMAEKSRDVMNL